VRCERSREGALCVCEGPFGGLLCADAMSVMGTPDWALVAVLAVPHCLYAFIWFMPKTFIACCLGAEPVGTFYKLAATLKGALVKPCWTSSVRNACCVRLTRTPWFSLCSRPVRRILPLGHSERPTWVGRRKPGEVGGICGATRCRTGTSLLLHMLCIAPLCSVAATNTRVASHTARAQSLNAGIYKAIGKKGVRPSLSSSAYFL